jgi:hypothetical protein
MCVVVRVGRELHPLAKGEDVLDFDEFITSFHYTI